jgi:hypothetical protein
MTSPLRAHFITSYKERIKLSEPNNALGQR